jgi:hypothetical protein
LEKLAVENNDDHGAKKLERALVVLKNLYDIYISRLFI